MLNFIISGVRVPSRNEPFAEEALEFARDCIHQREVEIEVETQDKGGNFIGNLFLKKKNFATTLLENGFAKLSPSADRSPYLREMEDAADAAKKANLKIWTLKDSEERAQKEEGEEIPKPRKELLHVVVTEVLDGGWLYVQVKGDELEQFEDMMDRIQQCENLNVRGYVPKPKTLCLAQFSDDRWYRARVNSVANDKCTVFYVDYGSVETLPFSLVRPIAPEFTQLPPQAKECFLAYITPPSLDDDLGKEAASYVKDLVWGKQMLANVEYRDRDGRMYVSLGDLQSQVHVNGAVVSAGLARVQKISNPANPQLLAVLQDREEMAKKAHWGMWVYGDISDDEDDMPASRPRGKRPGKR